MNLYKIKGSRWKYVDYRKTHILAKSEQEAYKLLAEDVGCHTQTAKILIDLELELSNVNERTWRNLPKVLTPEMAKEILESSKYSLRTA